MMPTTENMKMVQATNNEMSAAEGLVDISYFAVTGEGDRDYNEDFYGHASSDEALTFVVSDGVGGQAGGLTASRLVVEMVRKEAHAFDRDEMLRCYEAIKQAIHQYQDQSPDHKKMGATVAELRIDPVRNRALWGHFGDSRIYWFRNNEIMAVTGDHSAVHSLVTAGLMSEQEASNHSRKNILLGAFGVASDISPEVLEKPVYLADGDAFLLCTDGLWNYLSDDQILNILKQSSNVADWVKTLEANVKQAPCDSKDNYTILGVWITPSHERTIRLGS